MRKVEVLGFGSYAGRKFMARVSSVSTAGLAASSDGGKFPQLEIPNPLYFKAEDGGLERSSVGRPQGWRLSARSYRGMRERIDAAREAKARKDKRAGLLGGLDSRELPAGATGQPAAGPGRQATA